MKALVLGAFNQEKALVGPSPWMWNLNEGSLRALMLWWWHVTVSGPRCSAARGEKMDQAAVVFWAGLLRLPAPTGPFKLSTGHQLHHSANFYSTSTLLSAFEWWYSTQNFFHVLQIFPLLCQAQHWLQKGIAAMIVLGSSEDNIIIEQLFCLQQDEITWWNILIVLILFPSKYLKL